MITRRVRWFVTAAAISVVATVGHSASAQAASAELRQTSFNYSRSSDWSSYSETYRAGVAIEVVCQAFGSRWGSGTYANNMTWDKLSNGRWVHDMTTNLPGGTNVLVPGGYAYFTPGIPRCDSGTPRSAKLRRDATGYAEPGQREQYGLPGLKGEPPEPVRTAPNRAKGTSVTVVCQTRGPRWGSGKYAANATWNMLSDGTWIHDMTTDLPGGIKVKYGDDYAFYTAGVPRCP